MTFEQSFPEIYKMQIIKLSEEAHCEHLHKGILSHLKPYQPTLISEKTLLSLYNR